MKRLPIVFSNQQFEALSALLPLLRADANLYRRYTYTPQDPLPIPIQAFGGVDDPNISIEQLDAWRSHTASGFGMKQFPGGHFYLDSPSQHEFLDDFANDMALVCCLLTEG